MGERQHLQLTPQNDEKPPGSVTLPGGFSL